MVSKTFIFVCIKLFLAFLMVLLGSIALGGASTVDDTVTVSGGDEASEAWDDNGPAEDMHDALSSMGWWKLEYNGDLISYENGQGYDHITTVAIGLNGWAVSVEQGDFEGSSDDTYYVSADWIDEDKDWGEYMEDNCDDLEDIDGWDDLPDHVQQGLEAACPCRTTGGVLKAFAILMIFFMTVMSVFDILRLSLDCCGLDCVTCLARCFWCIQLTLCICSFVAIIATMVVGAFGCPVSSNEHAAGGFLESAIGSASVYVDPDDFEDIDVVLGGSIYMIIVVFLLHIPYLVLTCCTPKEISKPAAAQPQAGVPMQAAVQQPVAAARFDPTTGQPIPKFDPTTGKQNW